MNRLPRILPRSVRWAMPLAALAVLLVLAGCDEKSKKKDSHPVAPPPVGSTGGGGTTFTCGTPPSRTDPLFAHQWHLHNTGQTAFANFAGNANEDIHLCNATVRGTGVIVAVVDSGMEIAHEDLAANALNPDGSANPHSHNFAFDAPDPNDPTNDISPAGDHGTGVSGIIAGRSDNGVGVSGVAGRASLVAYNLLGPHTAGTAVEEAESLGQAAYSAGVHLFNQSWGVNALDAANLADISPDAEANYLDGVTTLRGGRGAIYVKAAGNGFGQDYGYPGECSTTMLTCQNANLDPYNTLPYQIVVGALNAKGAHSSYSTTGSALWVSAPGGEFGANSAVLGSSYPHEVYEPAIVTTDQSTCAIGYSATGDGINVFDNGNVPENVNCNYMTTFNGTSSATPVVAGVVALLLEAQPALTWRDVRHILAATSERVDAGFGPITFPLADGTYAAEPAWTTNAAGYHFHNWYGFGRVHVNAALAMIAGYTPNSLGTLTDTGFQAGIVTSGTVVDNSTVGATGTKNLAVSPTFIEAVQIRVNITHPYPGDVGIELRSPSGTRSVLFNIRSALGASSFNIVDWVILSNAFYGENPNGTWTLNVVDGVPGDSGVLNSWAIRIYGH